MPDVGCSLVSSYHYIIGRHRPQQIPEVLVGREVTPSPCRRDRRLAVIGAVKPSSLKNRACIFTVVVAAGAAPS